MGWRYSLIYMETYSSFKRYKISELIWIFKDTEKWIVEDNARNDHTSNQKQGSVTQKCYKNDPEFNFVAQARDELNYKTKILDVDTWSGNVGSYNATMSDAIITITSYSGEQIEYDIYYNGDSVKGTVSISDGVPSFVPSASL